MTEKFPQSSFGERLVELTTRRCVLRPLTTGDIERLHELWSSPGVRRFLWDGEVIPIARTRATIEQSRRMFAEQGFGLWAVWPIDSPSLTGFAGLWPFREPPELELLYGVAEDRWGRGYATEVAQAVVACCFDSLDMPVVRASTDAANGASRRVLEKLGFGFVRRSTVGSLETVFYELQRPAV
jgi:RimJ/RimL family protein N-acetyltransferase